MQFLITSTVVVALAGPITDDDALVLTTTRHDTKLASSRPEQWQTWASIPGRPRCAHAINGSDLVAVAEAHGADSVLIDVASASRFFITVEQLHALIALPPTPPWTRP